MTGGNVLENRYKKAIRLVQLGLKKEAQGLFQEILHDNPVDENAWLWLVECLDQPELRIKALETCLWINPKASRARTGLDALKHDLNTVNGPSQPMISVTGGETRYVFDDVQPNVWTLPEEPNVFTVSPEVISSEDVSRREARVYNGLSYRSTSQPAANPWDELKEAGDRVTSSPERVFRQPHQNAPIYRGLAAPTERENTISLVYTSLAVLIVSLLVILLAVTGSFIY